MRWIDRDVFVAGEPNPYPADGSCTVPAVRRRLRARPADPNPVRTWLLPSINGTRAWQRLYDAHHDAVIGHAWVRRSTLRWHRLAWTAWSFGLLAAVALTITADRSGRTDPTRHLATALVALALIALLLFATRIRAVLDPDNARVGIRA